MMDEHYTFHVGERVQIKEWNEMFEQYKNYNMGRDPETASFISTPMRIPFAESMKRLCGRDVIIRGISSEDGIVSLTDLQTGEKINWVCTLDMIKPIEFDPAPQINKPNWEEIFYAAD